MFLIGLAKFVVSEVKDTVPWKQEIEDLNGNTLKRLFYEKMLQLDLIKLTLSNRVV